MAERFKLVIPFNYDENWIGGVYYLKNLICALSLLPEFEQPKVILATNTIDSYKFIEANTRYPHLSWCTVEQILSMQGTLDVDVVFPYATPSLEKKTIAWIPDFQDKHMKELFLEKELEARTAWHEASFKAAAIVFSSRSVLRDFYRSYPSRSIRPFIVHFATFNEPAERPSPDFRKRYGVPEKYFYAPNQFWVHKNQSVILEALRILKQRGVEPFVCFSGKEHDHRAPGYSDLLRQKISDWDLEMQIAMLGFLPRQEQLSVIKGAHTIIQPSLFEGWSTVVEDAKSAGIFVIASDLAVHREQLGKNGEFFSPRDPAKLADLMEQCWVGTPHYQPIDYGVNQLQFANDFMRAVRFTISASKAADFSPIGDSPNVKARLESRLLMLQSANNILTTGRQDYQAGMLGPLGLQIGIDYTGGPALAKHLKLNGFSDIEGAGIWTISTDAVAEGIVVEGIKDNVRAVKILCTISNNPTQRDRWIEISVANGTPFRSMVTDGAEIDFVLSLPPSANVLLNIHIRTNFLTQAGPHDSRLIGVMLRSITLIPVSAPIPD